MWRLDELIVTDVDADVAATVEEDEIARLKVAVGNGNSAGHQIAGVVGKADPNLGEGPDH
jgi:hypothetical protein